MKAIDFDSENPPTQKQFDEYHKEPVDYGEDGDQLLGFNYTKEQAAEKFREHWKTLSGDYPDFDVSESVVEASAGWTANPDKYDGGEYCFVWLRSDSPTRPIVRFYKAWLLWV